jgi:hypothetical protein
MTLLADPFAEGDYFPGDLIENVLNAHRSTAKNIRDLARIDEIVSRAGPLPESLRIVWPPSTEGGAPT